MGDGEGREGVRIVSEYIAFFFRIVGCLVVLLIM